MDGILSGLRVIEGSAFVAAPLGVMTLAQAYLYPFTRMVPFGPAR